MKGGRRRVGGATLEQRIWSWLRQQPGPVKAADVAAQFGTGAHAAGRRLVALVNKGCAISTGKTSTTRYVATDMRPDDWRGVSIQSAQALRRTQRWKLRPPRVRTDGSALAQAWTGASNGQR